MKTSFLCLALCPIIMLHGCGGQKDKEEIPANQDLIGRWQIGCRKNIEQRLNITDKEITHTTQSYLEEECITPYMTIVSFLGYTVEGSEIQLVDTKPIHEIFEKKEITYHSELAVQASNSGSACGLRDWAINVSKDVTKSACNTENQEYYNIYKVENESLVFGKFKGDINGSSPETRPTMLDTDLIFKKF